MKLNQALTSVALSGYFGMVFMVAAPQLSFGLLLTYGAISTALGFGITALSKAIGESFDNLPSSAPPAYPDAPPPYVPPTAGIPIHPTPIIRPAVIIENRVPVRTPSFFDIGWNNPFRKPPERVVERHIEPSRPAPRHIPTPSEPPLFDPVPPPIDRRPVTFSSIPPKPPARVVEHLPPKPEPRVVAHSIQPSR